MPTAHRTQIGSLQCIVVDGGPSPRIAVVICHGYGANYEDFAPLCADWIGFLEGRASEFRFVLPDAPNSLTELGMPEAKVWWPINMEAFFEAVQAARFDELHEHEPAGIDTARQLLCETIAEVKSDLGGPSTPLVLGGFSQGAMLCMDASLRGDQGVPQVLFQFSGTVICRPQWQAAMHRLVETPVLQTHGTIDPVLPYFSAETLLRMMQEAGVEVDFHSFVGPHTIDGETIARSAAALATLADAT